MNLILDLDATARSATLRIDGDLDFATTRELTATVTELLRDQPALRHLHLDFADLTFCDSVGLSGLLLVRRRTARVGIQLHLANRPGHLERILDVTGILEHLTSRPEVTARRGPGQADEGTG